MTRAIHRTVRAATFASVVLTASCGPTAAPSSSSLAWLELGRRESERVAPGAIERKSRVVAELAESGLQRWAGHYAWNNRGNDSEEYECEEFWLAPRSGIVSCVGEGRYQYWNHGEIVADGGEYIVVRWASDPELTNAPDPSDSRFVTRFNLSERIDFVPWADELLIVPRVRMLDVVNAINAGFAGEYSTRKTPAVDTPVHEVDARSFAGALQLPAEFAALVLAAPLSAVIDDLDSDSVPDALRPEPAGEWTFEACVARVPIGSEDGVFLGMAFYAGARMFPAGYAVDVREHRSWIRFTLERGGDGTHYALPEKGETLTTRVP